MCEKMWKGDLVVVYIVSVIFFFVVAAVLVSRREKFKRNVGCKALCERCCRGVSRGGC